ncbi:HTH domain-containing protein [Streptomyces sp. MAR4 CNY-716]
MQGVRSSNLLSSTRTSGRTPRACPPTSGRAARSGRRVSGGGGGVVVARVGVAGDGQLAAEHAPVELQRPPRVSERLGVSDRTLRRDIGRLRGLGYRITAVKGPGGGWPCTGEVVLHLRPGR